MQHTFLGFVINTTAFCFGQYNLHILILKSSMDKVNVILGHLVSGVHITLAMWVVGAKSNFYIDVVMFGNEERCTGIQNTNRPER